MSEYAVMPLSDYVEVCNTVREYTENTQKIASQSMPSEIRAVYNKGYEKGKSEGGGGGSADPVADVVMAFIALSTATRENAEHVDSNVMFRLGDRQSNKGLAIIPPNVTYLGYSLGLVGDNEMISGNALVLSLPTIPPTTETIGFWASWGGNAPPEAIYVPDDSVVDYKRTTNWAEFSHLIKPMSYLVTGVLPDEPESTDIKFQVDGVEYEMPIIMTWSEWIYSLYNPFPDDWKDMNDDWEPELLYQNKPLFDKSNGNQVQPNDIIIDGGIYGT